MKTLSKYQTNVLIRATKSKDGATWALSATEHALAERGLLTLTDEHSPAKQKAMQVKIDRLVRDAKRALAVGNWQTAYQYLSDAKDLHREQTFMIYRITDAGRKAVAGMEES